MTTQEAAAIAVSSFVTKTRANGDSYVTLADDRPEWVQ